MVNDTVNAIKTLRKIIGNSTCKKIKNNRNGKVGIQLLSELCNRKKSDKNAIYIKEYEVIWQLF